MSQSPTANAVRALINWEHGRVAEVRGDHFPPDGPVDWHTLRNVLFVEILAPACIAAHWARTGGLSGQLLSNPVERAVWEHIAGPGPDTAALPESRAHILRQKRKRLLRAARGMRGAVRKRVAPGVLLTQSTQEGADDPNWGPLIERPEVADWLRLDYAYTRSPCRRGPRVLWDALVVEARIRGRKEIRRRLGRLAADDRWSRAIEDLQANTVPIGKLCHRAVRDRLLQAMRHSLQFYLAAELFLERTDAPIMGVYRELVPPACQLIRAARRRGIRTVAIQHGDLVPDLSVDLLEPGPEPAILPDINCVFGPRYRDILVEHARWDPSNVRVTGLSWHEGHRPQRCGQGPVLVASQTFVSSANRWAFHRLAAISMAQSPDLTYRVKLHPVESLGIRRLGLYPPGTAFVAGDVPLSHALDGCSAVLGCNSFALMEAVLLGFPVVSAMLPGEHIPQRAGLAPMMRWARGSAELADSLREARASEISPGPGASGIGEFLQPDPGGRRLLRVLTGGADKDG